MNTKIILIGGGGHARVLLEILQLNKVSILGFTDVTKTEGVEISYLGDDDILKNYSSTEVQLVNGIGSVKRPEKRREIYERFKSLGYQFFSVIHPMTIISSKVKLGEGVQVMSGAVINPHTVLKENVIINTSSSVDHDCVVGAHTHVAPGVTVSGGVSIGQGCHIGSGATIIQGITIGDDVLIGAGAIITRDISPGKIMVGTQSNIFDEDTVQ